MNSWVVGRSKEITKERSPMGRSVDQPTVEVFVNFNSKAVETGVAGARVPTSSNLRSKSAAECEPLVEGDDILQNKKEFDLRILRYNVSERGASPF